MNGTTHSGYTPDKHSAVGFNFSIVDVDLRHRLRFPLLPARRPPSSSSSVTRCCCPSSSSRTPWGAAGVQHKQQCCAHGALASSLLLLHCCAHALVTAGWNDRRTLTDAFGCAGQACTKHLRKQRAPNLCMTGACGRVLLLP